MRPLLEKKKVVLLKKMWSNLLLFMVKLVANFTVVVTVHSNSSEYEASVLPKKNGRLLKIPVFSMMLSMSSVASMKAPDLLPGVSDGIFQPGKNCVHNLQQNKTNRIIPK